MANISAVTICNMAIGNIGNSQPIEDFYPNERSTEAFQATLWYEHARRQALEDHDWNFARKRVALSIHEEAAPTGIWTYRYVYPSDCIKARFIESPSGPLGDMVPFEIEVISSEKTILTDAESANLIYTRDQTLTSLFSSKFVSTLSYLLAHYMAFPLTGDIRIKQNALEMYQGMLRSASGSNAQEGASRAPREASWISGR